MKLVLFSMVLNVILAPWETPIRSFAGYVLILLSILLPLSPIFDKRYERTDRKNVKAFTVILLLFVFVFSLLTSQNSSLDLDLMISVSSFLCTYFAILVSPQQYKMKDLKDIFHIIKIYSLVLIAYGYFPFSFRYNYETWGVPVFTMGIGNPNAVAIHIFVCISGLLIENRSTYGKYLKMVNFIIVGFLFYLLLLLKCRTVSLCALIMILLSILPKVPLLKWFTYVGIFIPIFLLFFQLNNSQSEVIVLDKEFDTGRSVIFTTYLRILHQSPAKYIFGQIGDHRLNNYHNGPLTILMNFGYIGLIVILGIWCSELYNSISNCKTQIQTFAILTLFMYLIHASTEGAPMMGMVLFGTPVVLFFRLAKDDIILADSNYQVIPEKTKYKYLR